MNVNEIGDFKYMDAFDVGDRDITVTVKTIQKEGIERPGGDADEKGVMYFEKARKGLILSNTNLKTLARLYGPETDAWTGKRVTLYVERNVKAFGKLFDVVRVRPVVPPPVKPKSREEVKADTADLYGDEKETPTLPGSSIPGEVISTSEIGDDGFDPEFEIVAPGSEGDEAA